jgi:type II secretory ATPase GspE/PulE/Tfp pilus assembly ATPase PilB-like protein
MTEEMNLIIAGNPTIAEIAIAAKKSGFRNMSDDAIEKVLCGVTSWEEVKNTIDMTNYLRHFDL